MRRYKLVSAPKGWPGKLPFMLHLPDGQVGLGEEFEFGFTAEEEAANLDSGLLELKPLRYRVVAGEVYGHQPGEEFELALRLGEEALLLEGGLIELPQPTKKKKGG